MNTSYTSYAPVISVRNLTKSYGQHTVLRDISLDIYPGESVAVMGPSGSGKTTLLHALSGIIRIDSGTIQVLGGGPEIPGGRVELGALSEKQRTSLRANSFGFIFQQGLLIPELTAEENVSLAAMISGVSREQARGASANLLARLGLGDMCEKRIGELSGGQAQRVAIARSQITGAPITFADEPTGALDSVTAQEVMDLLLTLVPQQGKTLVIVTHDPQVAAQCSRTIHLHDGQIVQDNRQDPSASGQQGGESMQYRVPAPPSQPVPPQDAAPASSAQPGVFQPGNPTVNPPQTYNRVSVQTQPPANVRYSPAHAPGTAHAATSHNHAPAPYKPARRPFWMRGLLGKGA